MQQFFLHIALHSSSACVHYLRRYHLQQTAPSKVAPPITPKSIILIPLMLSHLLVHLLPLHRRSQIAHFSMPRLTSSINFHFLLHEPVSPLYAYLNPSLSSPLSPSITPSLFHSKLKTYLFGNFFPPQISHHRHLELTSSANGTVFCSYCLCRC